MVTEVTFDSICSVHTSVRGSTDAFLKCNAGAKLISHRDQSVAVVRERCQVKRVAHEEGTGREMLSNPQKTVVTFGGWRSTTDPESG